MRRVAWGVMAVVFLMAVVVWAAPWTEVAPLNVARSKHRAVVLDGKIYVIGGIGPDKKCAPVEVYDPTTNTWTVVGPSPENCETPCLGVFDKTIFVLTGRIPATKTRTLEGYMGTVTAEGISWQKVPGQMTMAHADGASVVIGSRIYMISGEDDTLTNLDDDYVKITDVFDMATLTWTTAAPITPHQREDFDAAAVGSRIVVVGGQGGPENTALAWLTLYDAEANTWQHFDDGLPFPWEHPRAVTWGEHIYLFSGKGEGSFVNLRLDPVTLELTDFTPAPEPIEQCAVVELGGKIYMIGGVHLDGTLLNRVFVYDPREDG